MAITSGQDILASDFIDASEQNATPSNDAGRVAKLESDGRISQVYLHNAFGDGSDGDFDLDGTNTYSTILSKSGSDYTMLRDVYADNFEIPSGSTLYTAGYRLFVANRLFGAGKIFWNGNNGSNGENGKNVGSSGTSSGGNGGAAVTGYFSNTAGTNGGSAPGQSSGNPGGSATTLNACLGTAGGQGGAGGTHSGDTGGVGTTTGGAGGTLATRNTPDIKVGTIRFLSLLGFDLDPNPASQATSSEVNTGGEPDDFASHSHTISWIEGGWVKYKSSGGGTGGGGGGGSNASSNDQTGGGGGGGGASGGLIFICARIWEGTFEIEARGGNGGNGGDGRNDANDSAGGGGGGGGAGGVVIVIYELKTWTGSYDLAGGTAGTGGAEGGQGASTPAGSDGNAGSTGSSYEWFIGDLL